MYLINKESIDCSSTGLTARKKAARTALESGYAYNQFIMKADGRILMMSINSTGKITQKTLKPEQFKIIGGN